MKPQRADFRRSIFESKIQKCISDFDAMDQMVHQAKIRLMNTYVLEMAKMDSIISQARSENYALLMVLFEMNMENEFGIEV